MQKDSIKSFLFPFGYGDGGGGPTRDHIENVRRTKDIEGVPRTVMCNPVQFFKDQEKDGGPTKRYVGELYFQAHSGVNTSQAKTKKGNRKSEFALREVEMQFCNDRVLVEVSVPSCGWTTIKPGIAARDLEAYVKADNKILENKYLRVEFNDKGEITSIFDKETQWELVSRACNSLKMYKDVPRCFDAWDIDSTYELAPLALDDTAAFEMLYQGPLVAGFKIIRRKISIPRAEIDHSGRFNAIDGVVDYLNEYGIIIAEKIKGSFKPLFDPSLESVSGKIDLADDYLYKNKHIRLYPAQKAVAESVKRKLDTGKAAMIIAECGSGKTKISIIYLFHIKRKSRSML